MTETPVEREAPSPEFLQAYGAVMAEWSNLEVFLAQWFGTLAGIPKWRMAQGIFFSARSFAGRADMLMAVLDRLPVDGDLFDFVKEMLLKAIAYNGVRNRLAHGFVRFWDAEESITEPSAFHEPGEFKLTHLRTAHANFTELRRIAQQLHNHVTSSGEKRDTLERCRERLRALPNEACSSELSQKQKGRLRQLLTKRREQ